MNRTLSDPPAEGWDHPVLDSVIITHLCGHEECLTDDLPPALWKEVIRQQEAVRCRECRRAAKAAAAGEGEKP